MTKYMGLPRVSLIIITKNRDVDLAACYRSLMRLAIYPDEFILVDSSTNNKSKIITHQFAKAVPFPVRYLHEPRLGFPIARNRGLAAAIFPWAAFTDDDCVADPQFIHAIKTSIRKHPKTAAIAGESKSFYTHSLMSHVTAFNEHHWKSCARRGNRIYDLETLDNKNVVYNMVFFKQHRISYDEARTLFDGASDDCDLGMQIQRAGGHAYYEKKMIVYHKDAANVLSFIMRTFMRQSAQATYERKWSSYRSGSAFKKISRVRFRQLFKSYAQSNRLSRTTSILLLCMILCTSLLVLCIKKIQKTKMRMSELLCSIHPLPLH